MTDTTLIYYTANKIPEGFARKVREHLVSVAEGRPIISVSQQPIDFGFNIHAKGLVPCMYNVYKQILMGAERANTKYVACCEDDSLYSPEHFNTVPPERTFFYNRDVWHLRPKGFFYNGHILMSQCIVETEYMVETLRLRFEKFKDPDAILGSFGEPGREENKIGLPPVGCGIFHTKIKNITIRHKHSLSGIRNSNSTLTDELPHWGNALALWQRFYIA